MMTIEVQYFAVLREQAGCGTETLQTNATTASELYRELQDRHGLAFPADSLRVAVNDEFADWSHPLESGDCIVFIPPVAGG
jgi:molybdopterin converting factor subunit 1